MIALAVAAVSGLLGCGWLAYARARRCEAVARAVHELRGPLQAVALGISLEARREPEAGRWRVMERELARARLALDDLTGARTCRLQPVRARELLEEAAGAAAARGATVSVHWSGPEATVWCGRLRITQALANLVANAIEHGGPTVALRAQAVPGVVRFEVCDDGPGLPAPVAALTRRARRGRGRRGRGLAIAAAIATEHGGRLAGAPAQRGARLVLELPVAPPPPVARALRALGG